MKKMVSRLVAMMAAMSPVVTFGAFYDPSFYGQEVQVNVSDFQPTRIPGEFIDRRTGQLAWQEEEFVVSTPTGWKLPIIRSYGNGVNGPKHFGNWELELPRIIINTSPAADVVADYTSETICQNPSPRPFYGYVDGVDHGETPASAYAAPMRLFIPGEETQTLVRKLSGLPGFPADAVWVTKNNWFAKCLADSEGFEVYAPDGRVYRMDLVGRNPDYWVNGGGGKGHVTVHATSARNVFGETFLFDYDVIATEAWEAEWHFTPAMGSYLTDNIMLPSKPFLRGVRFGREGDAEVDFVTVVEPYYEQGYDSKKYPLISELLFIEHASYGGAFASTYTGLVGPYNSERRIRYNYGDPGPSMYCALIEDPEWSTKCEGLQHFMQSVLLRAGYPNYEETFYRYGGPLVGSTSDGVTTASAYSALTGVGHRNGAGIDYTYQKLPSGLVGTSGRSWLPALASRKLDYDPMVDIGHEAPPYETRYEFSLAPEGTRSHRFRGLREDLRFYSVDDMSDFGLLQKEVLIADGIIVGEKHYNYGDYKTYGAPHPVTASDEHTLRRYLLTSTTDGPFSSTFTHESMYGLVESITEQGMDGSTPVSRLKTFIYQHPYMDYGKAFVIGLVQQEMVGAYEVSYADYNWQGLPVFQRKKGAERRFMYFVEPEFYEPSLGRGNWTNYGAYVGDVLTDTSGFPARVTWSNQQARSLRLLGLKAGRPEAILWSDDSEAYTGMTTQGRVIERRARDGVTTYYNYYWGGDLAGIRYSAGYSGSAKTAPPPVDIYWDPYGRELVQFTGERELTQRFDPFGNVVVQEEYSAVDDRFVSRFWQYDRYGNRIFESVPDASYMYPDGVRYGYDFRDRLDYVDYGDGFFRRTCYHDSLYCATDPGTLSRQEEGANGENVWHRMKSFTRDGLHVSTHVKEDLLDEGYYTSYRYADITYDELLQPLGVTREGNPELSYTYDPYGRLLTAKGGNFEYTLGYYRGGELRTRSWGDGRSEYFEYTGLGDLARLSLNGEVMVENDYDMYGRLATEWNMKDSTSTSYEYGAYGRIFSERLNINGQDYVFQYEYSPFGEVGAVTYPSGNRYDWGFDAFGRPTGIDGIVHASRFSRWGTPQELVYANGMVSEYLDHDSGGPSYAAVYRPDGRLLYGREFDFHGDALPDRSLDLVTTEETFYRHDLVGRVLELDYGSDVTSFVYDFYNIRDVRLLNNQMKQFSYSWPDGLPTELSSPEGTHLIEHDSAGNVSRLGDWALSFDNLGRLETLSAYSTGQGTRFGYTARGQVASASSEFEHNLHYVFSSVLGRTLYIKNLHTGISTDHLYFRDHLVAMVDEIPDVDSDGDGVQDGLEFEAPALDPFYPHPEQFDWDGDSVGDLEEIRTGLLLNSDDSDEDGMSDGDELANGLDPFNDDAGDDEDLDGLTNIAELEAGLDPHNADTDSDGFGDAEELARGTLGNASPDSPLFVSSEMQNSWVRDVLVSAHGDYLYAIVQMDLVVYQRDPVSGSFSERHRYPDSAAYYGSELYEHPSRPIVFARKKGRVSVLRQDAATGALVLVQNIDEDLHDLAFSPDGSLVYASAPATQTIQVYAVNAVNRLELRDSVDLSGIVLTPYGLVVGETALFVLAEPDQVVALPRDPSSGVVDSLVLASWESRAISASGELTHAPGSGSLFVTVGSGFHALAWTSTAGGESLVRVGGGSGGQGLTLNVADSLLMSIQGWSDRLYVYEVAGNGAATFSSEARNGYEDVLGAVIEGMDNPIGLSLSPDGRHLYIASSNSRSITHFRFDRFVDLDSDGVNDAGDDDTDGDGVADELDAFPYDSAETQDTDGDGVGDNADAFPSDTSEFRDTDGDGTGDNSDLDADGDGIDDAWERQHGLDPGNSLDADLDQDSDGLTNQQEYLHGTDPNKSDTDGDGGLDGDEIAKGTDPVQLDDDLDSDGDGCPNRWEIEFGFTVYDDGVQSPSSSLDQDGDGLDDLAECEANSNPAVADSDGDGVGDAEEADRGTLPDVAEHTPLFVASYGQDNWVHDVLVSEGRQYLFAVVQTELRVYRRDLVTGALTEAHRYSDYAAYYGSELYQYPGYPWIYARKKGRVTVMRLDQSTGELAVIQVLDEDASDLAFSVTGGHVYAAQPADESILVLVPNEVGHLVPQQRLDISSLALKPYGIAVGDEELFVLGEPDKVVALPRDPSTGEIESRVLASWANAWLTPAGRLVHEPSVNTIYVSRGSGQAFDIVDWDGTPGAETLTRTGGGTGADGLSLYRRQEQLVGLSSSTDTLYVYKRQSGGAIERTDVLRNADSDALGSIVAGMDSPESLSMSWDGLHLYLASRASKSITHFRFDRFTDLDGDGLADTSDADVDGDGIENDLDAFPYDQREMLDTDGDGYGDDQADVFPLDASEFRDTDGDGIGNNADPDADGDGMPDEWEGEHGLDPHDDRDAGYDQDHDGVTNLQEFLQGSDPNV